MGDSAKKLLEEFDALPLAERQEVVREILRRTAPSDYSFPTDEELVTAADQVFLELDQRESHG